MVIEEGVLYLARVRSNTSVIGDSKVWEQVLHPAHIRLAKAQSYSDDSVENAKGNSIMVY